MKKIKNIVKLMALCMPVVLQSCSQEEGYYSCDKEANNWVRENKEYIQTLTRAQWYTLDYKVSQASYIAFTPSQKTAFWKEKLEEVKSLDWSEEELVHIEKAEDYVMSNPQYFRDEKLTDEELDEIESYFVKWVRYGRKKFGWSKQTAMAIVGTGYKMLDKKGTILLPKRSSGVMSVAVMSTKEESDCNCNQSSFVTCVLDPFGGCESAKCRETNNECGMLLVYPCNGRCGGVSI